MRPNIAVRSFAAALCIGAGGLLVGAGAAGAQSPPPLAVKAAALYAPATGQLLYGIGADRRLAIASTTKLMTALITVERIHHLSTVLTQNDYYPAATDSQIGLVPGERMSGHDLLLALMLPSADDAAEDLAYNLGHGSISRFVGMMNARARALGLRHTHYATPIGLDTPGNYSSARDLVRLASYDLSHSRYLARIAALPSAVLRSGNHIRYVVNRNDLVGRVPWITGVKTGHTARAGYVLVASGHRQGMTLISAVLGTSSIAERDSTTMALLRYGFDGFRVRTPVRSGQVLTRVRVPGQPGVRATLVAGRALKRVLPATAALSERVVLTRSLTGPLQAGTVVGQVEVISGRKTLGRAPVVLATAIAAAGSAPEAARLPAVPLLAAAAALAALAFGAALKGFAQRRPRHESSGQGGAR